MGLLFLPNIKNVNVVLRCEGTSHPPPLHTYKCTFKKSFKLILFFILPYKQKTSFSYREYILFKKNFF